MISLMRRFLVPLAVALLTITAPTGASHAAPILDQVFDPGPAPTVSAGISGVTDKAQTFTVGIAGTLARVEVDIRRDDNTVIEPLLFDVRATTAGGAPIESNSTTLASVSIAAASIPVTPGFVSVDVSAFGIPVTPGEILAIVLRKPGLDDVDYIWFGGEGNPYPAGSEYSRITAGGTWTASEGNDLGFRTFVTVSAVPAPSGVVLLGMGVSVLAGVTWRRHRRR